ncbi:choice-of-anchor I family protein [Caproicibacter sp.]|uniref:choice-of-anchor I family protein n=1 Tax=Caproicibacter sp. TaxID=2814884 RepID=UPI003988CFAA
MRLQSAINRRALALLLAGAVSISCLPMQALAAENSFSGYDSNFDSGSPIRSSGSLLSDLGSLQISSEKDPDGGCAEIVKYNPDNRRYYVLDGKDKKLAIVDMNRLAGGDPPAGGDRTNGLSIEKNIDFSDAGTIAAGIRNTQADFSYGDLTSVAIDTNRNLVAVSVQDADYTKPGAVVLLDYGGNFVKSFRTGVQPDMVCFSPGGNYALTADEGEPRNGYGSGTVDPKGSVTVVDLSRGLTEAAEKTVDFTVFDSDSARNQLIADGVILKHGAKPSEDLEPEYIAVAGNKAYVTLQEANAIAELDLTTDTFDTVKGLGFQDYGKVPVDVLKSADPDAIKDSAYLETESTLRGIYMPDGIAVVQEKGKTYLLTANEGDSREWGSGANYYCNEYKYAYKNKSDYKKLTCLATDSSESDARNNGDGYEGYDGNFEDGCHYLFGGRSFSVWDAGSMGDSGTLRQVYDTHAQFEAITAELDPGHFNCSNDDTELDSRSNKKGPEPEGITVGTVNGTSYAFIGLERIGGVMAYDITDPANPTAVDYLNQRNFSLDIAGDDSPEGIDFVPAADSPVGYPMLLVGNEVSGTVSLMRVGNDRNTDDRKITIFHTNDMHGALATAQSRSAGSDLVAAMKKSVPGSLLIDAGDATQGSSFATLTKGRDVIRLMNAAAYDGMAVGNHEFDYGQDLTLTNAQAAEFPMLAANVLKSGKPFLQGIQYCGGAKTDNGAYSVEYAEGLKIGVFGITTPETAFKTNPAGTAGISFGANDVNDIVPVIQNQIDNLRNTEKCDIVVGAMHLGDDPSSVVTAKAIVPEIQGLDLLIDGHSHQLEQIEDVKGKDGKAVPIVQTGSSSANVGKVELSWSNEKKAVDKVSTELISAAAAGTAYTPDAAVTKMANEILDSQKALLAPIVGLTKTTLWGGTINGINEARLAETNLGSLVADSMRWKAQRLITADAYKNLPVVALQNGGGVRAVIKAGSVTVGSVLNVLPFGNTLAFKEVTPDILYSALENGVGGVTGQDASTGRISGAAGAFPQISGFKFTYDPRQPKGSRVTSVTLDSGAALNRNDKATRLVLASNDYELAGGDNYTMLAGLPSVGEGGALDTVLEDYLTSKGSVSVPITSGRITCSGGYIPKPYDAKVTVKKGAAPVADTAVDYQVDGGTVLHATTGADGTAILPALPDGPHAVKIGDADDVLVNNYSGAGVTAAVTATVNATVSISHHLKLAIISDTHVYDDSLGTTGKAFEEYLANDRKMIVESEKILDEALSRIKASDADYVLISGDLTKDGEKQDHERMAQKLKALEDATGKQVIVIDGNHDLSNADAVRYNADGTTTPVDTIDRAAFKSIYADFGYDLAVAQDPDSLSYAVDLGSRYRLIVMDSAIYNNETAPGKREQQTGGSLTGNAYDSNNRLPWIMDQIRKAKDDGRIPIGMEHHGLVPHTAVQPQFFPEYLLNDYRQVSQELADAGMHLVFTGHFHSQDVAAVSSPAGNMLYDMETGSLVTDPCPIRYVTLDGENVTYTSDHIDSVAGLNLGQYSNFSDYEKNYLLTGIIGLVPGMLKAVGPSLTDDAAKALANQQIPGSGMTLAQFLAACMAKHYAGDETPGVLAPVITALRNSSDPLQKLLGGTAWALANDTTGDLTNPKLDTVPDNAGSIDLSLTQPSLIVSSFDELDASVKSQRVANGTPLSALNLPDSLNATVGGSASAINGITWSAGPSYTPTAAGTYLFTAVLPSGYALADGVGAPVIRVEVSAAKSKKSGSGGSSSSGLSAPAGATGKSTITTAVGADGRTTTTVSTRPDSEPVVTGDHSSVSVTVPANVASILAAATAAKPAEVRITAPTGALTEQIRNDAVQTVHLTIRVPSAVTGNTNANARVSVRVEPAVLQAAKDARKNVTLTVTNEETGREAYSWTFFGTGLKNSVSTVAGIDLALSVSPVTADASASAAAAKNTAGQKAAGLLLRFADNGLLPSAAQMRVYVGDQANCAPGSTVFLYYLNRTTNQLEQMPQSRYIVDGNGYVTFSIIHCSDYILLPQAATHPYPVKSDTSHPVSVQNGRTYTFAFTVTGTAAPSFAVGNGTAFASRLRRKDNTYFFTIKAIGKSGQMTAVYCTLPGQKPVMMDYVRIT